MKLELKFIAPYYIHGLECQLFWTKEDGSLEFERIGKLIELKEKTKDQHPLVFKCQTSENSKLYIDLAYDFSEVKPLLLPLSALTEPLEDGSIPIEYLGKLYEHKGSFKDGFFGWDVPTWGDDYQDYYLTISKDLKFIFWKGCPDDGGYNCGTENIPFEAIEYLYSIHADIYGLIDAGLAYDKRTIKSD